MEIQRCAHTRVWRAKQPASVDITHSNTHIPCRVKCPCNGKACTHARDLFKPRLHSTSLATYTLAGDSTTWKSLSRARLVLVSLRKERQRAGMLWWFRRGCTPMSSTQHLDADAHSPMMKTTCIGRGSAHVLSCLRSLKFCPERSVLGDQRVPQHLGLALPAHASRATDDVPRAPTRAKVSHATSGSMLPPVMEAPCRRQAPTCRLPDFLLSSSPGCRARCLSRFHV